MTAYLAKTLRLAGLMLAFAVSLSALSPTAGLAFSAEAQQMCNGDAFRLCSSEIPNIPKITACMYKHRADLSTGCRTVMDRDLAARQSSRVAAHEFRWPASQGACAGVNPDRTTGCSRS